MTLSRFISSVLKGTVETSEPLIEEPKSGPPERHCGIAAKHGAGGEAKNHWSFLPDRPMAAGSGGRTDGKSKVEVPHDAIHRMIVVCMVSFIKDEKADLPAEVDVSMTESVENDLRGGNYNTVFLENVLPQVGVRPLFGF